MTQRVAYVTGGMGGIGTAIFQRLHKQVFKVVAGCGPQRDYGRWLEEQQSQGYQFHASVGNAAHARITHFIGFLHERCGAGLEVDYFALQDWSLAHPEAFSSVVWDFCGEYRHRPDALSNPEALELYRDLPELRA